MPLDGPKELPGAVHESVPQFVTVVLAELLLIRMVGLHVQDAYFLFLDDFDPGELRLLVGQLRKTEDKPKRVAFLQGGVGVDGFQLLGWEDRVFDLPIGQGFP